MQKAGEILRKTRKKKGKTITDIHQATRISIKNLKALERDQYHKLPSSAFIKGFIQIYAKAVGLKPEKMVAVFRRDYGKETKTEILPNSVDTPSFWNPKTFKFFSIIIIVLIVLFYFVFQINRYFSPPSLELKNFSQQIETTDENFTIEGKAEEGSAVYVNQQLIDVENEGNFKYSLQLLPGKNEIKVKAVDNRGKETVVVEEVVLK